MKVIKLMNVFSTLLLVTLICTVLLNAFTPLAFSKTPQLLDSFTIPKWINQLNGPLPMYVPTNITDDHGNVIRQDYVVNVMEFYQQILPTVDVDGNPTGFGLTKVGSFGGKAKYALTGQDLGFVRNVPGPTFEAIRGIPVQVKWVNGLVDAEGVPLQHMFPVDPTIHWANPNNIDMMETRMQVSQGLAPPFPPGYNGTHSLLTSSYSDKGPLCTARWLGLSV